MAKVYFSKTISAQKILQLMALCEDKLTGKVAVKVHSGEKGNQNFLHPEFWADVINHVNGTVVECNTAYEGARNTTERHLALLKEHGWDIFPVDLLDAQGPDLELDIANGTVLHKNYVGKNLANYDSMLVLSHFKGHPSGGYGGAIKQLSIGCASSYGKKYIHGAGNVQNYWHGDHNDFLRSMADTAMSVIELFQGKILYVNVMKNMSVDCDCCAVAEDPCMQDVGVLVSTDPVAIDKACVDLVFASKDKGRDHLVERINSRNGLLTIDVADQLGYGSKDYQLVEID